MTQHNSNRADPPLFLLVLSNLAKWVCEVLQAIEHMATTTFDVSASAVEGSSKEKAVSLQGAFQQYRNKRQVSFAVDHHTQP